MDTEQSTNGHLGEDGMEPMSSNLIEKTESLSPNESMEFKLIPKTIVAEEGDTKQALIKELEAANKKLQEMLENVKLATVVLDTHSNITFINDHLLKITGRTREEVLGKNFVDLFIPEELKEAVNQVQAMAFKGICTPQYQNEILTKAGKRIVMRWNNSLLKDVQGNVIGTNSIGEDLVLDQSEMLKRRGSLLPDEKTALNDLEHKFLLKNLGSTEQVVVGDYVIVVGKNLSKAGNIKAGWNRKTMAKVVVKMIPKEGDVAADRAYREIDIMKRLTELNHPFIAKLLDTIETPHAWFMVMEHGSGGDLRSYIYKKGGLTERESHRLFSQIIAAVYFCHQHSILHRDIKHENICLDDSLNVKLIDFGLSNYHEEGMLRSTFCGTPAYAAPEILFGTKYGPEVDVWSLGVVLYSMLTNRFPFTSVADIMRSVFKIPSTLSPECVNLLKAMLMVDRSKRATLKDVIHHSWVISPSSTKPDIKHVIPLDPVPTALPVPDVVTIAANAGLSELEPPEDHSMAEISEPKKVSTPTKKSPQLEIPKMKAVKNTSTSNTKVAKRFGAPPFEMTPSEKRRKTQ